MSNQYYSEITPDILNLSKQCTSVSYIDPVLYTKYDVKRGLRDLNGKGVTAGLTEISAVMAKKNVDGKEIPCDGQLFYRGQNVEKLVWGFAREGRFGYEEIAYLLLFGSLPDEKQLKNFSVILSNYRTQLPTHFVRDIIMNAPSQDMMNVLARGVLTLYAYDDQADDISIPNVLRQCLQLISMLPLISVFGYQTYQHYYNGKSLYIHTPQPELSFAENILHLLRKDGKYTDLEAHLLDIALVLHMEHGGGNNSTFTTHVVSSSGTDTYSSFAASLGSLKGPRHGGANIKVIKMMADLQEQVHDWKDEDEIRKYLRAVLNRDAFDHSGLIYGIGHAVYSLSDPRAVILKSFVERLSQEKGRAEEFHLYNLVERLAPEVISEKATIYKGVSANVDFYSGFVYSMLNLPLELYTPIFAIARTVGWSAHRIEELANNGKIIRPAYLSISKEQEYTPLKNR
ncbi:MAG: citrate/2-methylcitrate synthase [Lachnospiraceae bacterium]|nr:citrate/2-methylcitrate synthase [Lachnospiraceae bacterium]